MLLPGDALYRLVFATDPGKALAGRYPPGPGERLLLRFLGGGLLVGWWALVLAEAGVFGRGAVLAGVVAASAVLYGLAWRRGPRRLALARPRLRPTAAGLALAAILALSAAISFSHPFETIVGAADAGIYFNAGGSIARTGGILVRDAGLAEFGDAAADADAGGAARHFLRPPGKDDRYYFVRWQRLPGFFLLLDAANTVTPQFLHLFPAWLALWAVFGGGVGAMVYGGPAFGLLGVALAHALARRLCGPAVGLLAALFMALNGLQVWFARESLSETLLQILLLGAIYAYVLFIDARRAGDGRTARGAALLAGAALGSVALAHALFPFALLPLAALLGWLWLARGWRRVYWWLFVPVLLLTAHAAFHIARYALGYFEGIYHHVWLDAWHDRYRMAAYLLAPIVLVAVLDRLRGRWLPFVTDRRNQRWARRALAAAVALAAAYLYLVRPGILRPGALAGYIGAPVAGGAAADLVRLGWYFSPLGIALAFAGLTLLLLCDFEERTAALLCATGPFVLLYLTGTYTQEGYIYSLRRYMPLIMPVGSILAAYAALRLGPALAAALGRPRLAAPLRALGLGAAALLVLFFAYTNWPLIRHREYAGLLDQVTALADRFGPRDIVLFSGPRDETPQLATPLEYLFGRETWVITTNLPRGDLLDAWIAREEAAGRAVHVVMSADGGKLLLPGHRLTPDGQADVTLRQFEELTAQKPHNEQVNHLDYSVYTPEPLRPGESPLGPLPYRVAAGAYDEPAQVQGFYNVERAADGRAYRWTDGNALLRVPWPGDGRPLTLRLTLSGGLRPAALGPARVVVGLLPNAGAPPSEERVLTTLTLGADFATYTIAIPAGALPPTPDGTAVLHLGVTAPPGRPGSTWRPADWPAVAGATYDARDLHVRFAGLALAPAP
ncbi:MAG TPA: hypothetical protein VFW96_15645 [Thermomicrobiales bacterium]|nr:hypothetical protein [Thermomicrobiales bacterium]